MTRPIDFHTQLVSQMYARRIAAVLIYYTLEKRQVTLMDGEMDTC